MASSQVNLVLSSKAIPPTGFFAVWRQSCLVSASDRKASSPWVTNMLATKPMVDRSVSATTSRRKCRQPTGRSPELPVSLNK